MAACWRAVTRDVIFAGSLGLGADLVCQTFEGKETIDKRRALAVSAFSGAYVGVVCSYVYSLYPSLAVRLLTNPCQKRIGVVGSVTDNAVHVPALYIPSYFMTVGLMQGESIEHATKTLKEQWWDTTSTCWMFWVPVMALNFTMVPPTHQVRVVAAANFCWTIALDYVTHL